MAHRLFGSLTADPNTGTLDWHGESLVVVPLEALCDIQRSSEELHGAKFASELLASAGVACGQALAQRLGRGGAEETIRSCLETAREMGLGSFSLKRFDGHGALEIEVAGSPFAAALGPADVPTCSFLSGLVNGIAQALLGVGIGGEEAACAASGAPCCILRTKAIAVDDEGGGWGW